MNRQPSDSTLTNISDQTGLLDQYYAHFLLDTFTVLTVWRCDPKWADAHS